MRGLHFTTFILSAQCHRRMGTLYCAAPFMAKYKGKILVCFLYQLYFSALVMKEHVLCETWTHVRKT